MRNVRFNKGFSLVELMVVLAILGLVFVGFSSSLGSFNHSSSIEESKGTQANIKKQLLNFVVVNKYLPCPDTTGDGQENRNGSRCSADIGGVPHRNLGLEDEDVQDDWGNPIRYAVNTDADDAGVICDITSSASMFCNEGIGRSVSSTGVVGNIPWFSLTDTPPFAANPGAGNYFVCNEVASTADCAGTPTSANLITDSAVAVLIAYNQDGATTLANCAGTTNATNENCDTDNLYHQQTHSYSDAARFDDVITYLTGQEVKTLTLSPMVTWNSFDSSSSGVLTPTYETFDISTNADVNASETSGDDVVLVNRNVSEAVDLGSGDDYLVIGNNLETSANLETGSGDDTLYIVGAALSNINLGNGNDVFVLGTDLANELLAKGGNDQVWIQGSVVSGATLQMNAGDDILWLGDSSESSSGQFNTNVNGGSGYDILVLENVEDWSDLTTTQTNRIRKFELVIFSDDGSGNRNYHVCTNVSNKCT